MEAAIRSRGLVEGATIVTRLNNVENGHADIEVAVKLQPDPSMAPEEQRQRSEDLENLRQALLRGETPPRLSYDAVIPLQVGAGGMPACLSACLPMFGYAIYINP